MMSLFCCKDTKNIVSRKIKSQYFARNGVKGRFAQNSDREIVFISRGNVRENNGFPRLIMLIDVFQFLSILLWEDAELLLEAFGEILRSVEAHLLPLHDQNVRFDRMMR